MVSPNRTRAQNSLTTDSNESPARVTRNRAAAAANASISSPASKRSVRKVNVSPELKTSNSNKSSNAASSSKASKSVKTGDSSPGKKLSKNSKSSAVTPNKSKATPNPRQSPATRQKRSRPSSSEDDSPTPVSPKKSSKKLTKKQSNKRVKNGNSQNSDRSDLSEDQSVNGKSTPASSAVPRSIRKFQSETESEELTNGTPDIVKDSKKLVPLITALDANTLTLHSNSPSKSDIEVPSDKVESAQNKEVTSSTKSLEILSCKKIGNGTSTGVAQKSSEDSLHNNGTSQKSSRKRKLSTTSPDKTLNPQECKRILVNGSPPLPTTLPKKSDISSCQSEKKSLENHSINDLDGKLLSKGSSSSISDCVTSEHIADSNSELEEFLKNLGLSSVQSSDIYKLLPQEVQDARDKLDEWMISSTVWCVLRHTSDFSHITFPRCNKLVRQLLDHYCALSQPSVEQKMKLFEDCVSWATEKHRSALSHELQVSQMMFYSSISHWKDAEITANQLYKTVKPLQDKEKIVKACLCLSRCCHAFGNLSKARGFITTAKTEALKIYTPPDLPGSVGLAIRHSADSRGKRYGHCCVLLQRSSNWQSCG